MIAITGANGLLGSFIVRKLIEMNQPFVALKRKGSDTSLLQDVNAEIKWRDADVNDPVALNEALHNITHVIHTAAIVSFNPRDADKIYNVNVQGTRNVVNACLVNGVKRLVQISSVAALGRQKEQTTINESNTWISNTLNSVYAESKYQAELEVFRAQEEGISTVVISPSVILAPADWNKSSAQLFKYVYREKPFYIDGFLNYVDVRDVALITCKLLHSEIENCRFIANAGVISFKDFFDIIAKRFNKKAPSYKLGSFLLKVVAGLEYLRSRITYSNPLITFETARLAGTRFNYNNQKIRETLNFEFEIIDKTLQWCCESYMAKINTRKK
jgi:nucleoside-diphosphate-sugar epimerase